MAGLLGTRALSPAGRSLLPLLAAASAAKSPPPCGPSGLPGSLRGPGLLRGRGAGGPGLASGGLRVLLHFSQSTWRGRRRMGLRASRPGSRLRVRRRRVLLMVRGGGCGTHCWYVFLSQSGGGKGAPSKYGGNGGKLPGASSGTRAGGVSGPAVSRGWSPQGGSGGPSPSCIASVSPSAGARPWQPLTGASLGWASGADGRPKRPDLAVGRQKGAVSRGGPGRSWAAGTSPKYLDGSLGFTQRQCPKAHAM